MISVVLVEPENPGNIGAVSRAMKNFGFHKLILVNPKCDHLSEEARRRAKHSLDILKSSEVINFLEELKADYKVATTSKLGSDYNVARTPLTPKIFAEKLDDIHSAKVHVSIIFGRESSGLTNDEIDMADFLVSIPSDKYSALNLSHAVSIVLYETYQSKNRRKTEKRFTPITRKEIDTLQDAISSLQDKQGFSEQKRELHRKIWKRIITKSMMTRREAFSLLGFFRKLL